MAEGVIMDEIYLTQKQLDELLEYSTSIPTGTTEGKQWKRHIFTFKMHGVPHSAGYIPGGITEYKESWLVGEYGKPIDNKVPIKWRRVVMKGEEIPNKINALDL
jgi:hypothetical protein